MGTEPNGRSDHRVVTGVTIINTSPILLICLSFQPSRNTHPGFIAQQYLVLQFAAFKKYALAVHGRYQFGAIVLVYAQLTAIGGHPTFIEVHHHAILPAAIGFKLVDVFFIKAAGLVQRIMKFVAGNAGKAGTVQMLYKTIHQIEKYVFGGVVVRTVQPIDLIATHQVIQYRQSIVTRTRWVEHLMFEQ